MYLNYLKPIKHLIIFCINEENNKSLHIYMNNKKIVCEIILIPVCILYLILSFLKSGLAAGIILTAFAIITAIWLVPKYIDELYGHLKSLNNRRWSS